MRNITAEIELAQIKNYLIVIIVFSCIQIAFLSTLIIFASWCFIIWRLFNLYNNDRAHWYFISVFSLILLLITGLSKKFISRLENNVFLTSLDMLLPPLFFLSFSYFVYQDLLKELDAKLKASWETSTFLIIIFQGIAVIGRIILALYSLRLKSLKTIALTEALQKIFLPHIFLESLYIIPVIYIIITLKKTVVAIKSKGLM